MNSTKILHVLFLLLLAANKLQPSTLLGWISLPILGLWIVSTVLEAGCWRPSEDILQRLFQGLIPLTTLSFISVSVPFDLRNFLILAAVLYASWRIVRPSSESGLYLLVKLLREVPFIPGILLIVLGLTALIPRFYHDGLNYHLLGPWLWSQSGGLAPMGKYIPAFHCNYFEQLYYWAFLGLPFGFSGQIEVQILSQLFHFFFGGVISSLIILRFFRLYGLSGQITFTVGLCFILFRLSLGQLITVAKNDWTLIALGLFLIYQLFEKDGDEWIIGMVMGYTFVLKFSYAPFLLLVLLMVLIKRPVSLVKIAGMSLVIVIPFLGRNFVQTGNPFFPIFPEIFSSEILGPTWIQSFSELGELKIGWVEWVEKFHQRLMAKNVLNIGFYFLPFYFLKTHQFNLLRYWIFSVLSLIFLFLLSSISLTETRHSGASIVMLEICLAIMYLKGCEKLKERTLRFISQAFILACVLYPYRFAEDQHQFLDKGWMNFLRKGPESYVEQHLGFEMLSFLRKRPDLKIVCLSDLPLYYFAPLGMVKAWDWSAVDRIMTESKSVESALREVKKLGFTHIFVNEYFFDRMLNRTFVLSFLRWLSAHHSNVVYAQKDARLIDLMDID